MKTGWCLTMFHGDCPLTAAGQVCDCDCHSVAVIESEPPSEATEGPGGTDA